MGFINQQTSRGGHIICLLLIHWNISRSPTSFLLWPSWYVTDGPKFVTIYDTSWINMTIRVHQWIYSSSYIIHWWIIHLYKYALYIVRFNSSQAPLSALPGPFTRVPAVAPLKTQEVPSKEQGSPLVKSPKRRLASSWNSSDLLVFSAEVFPSNCKA